MKNLFKYELRKTLLPKIVLACGALLIEIFFLFALFSDRTGQQAVAIAVIILLGTFGILFIGIQSLLTLHRDMNTRQGYMLFMTPNSNYKILGAKVLENTCSTFMVGAIFFLLACLDVRLMASRNQDLTVTVDMLSGILSAAGGSISFNAVDAAFFSLYMIMSWIGTVTLAYFADILVSSVLNGKKFSMLLGFILFLILSFAVGKIEGVLPKGNGVSVQFGIGAAYYAVITILTYFGSAKLMERHLSI